MRRLLAGLFSVALGITTLFVTEPAAEAQAFQEGVWTETAYASVFRDSLPSGDAGSAIKLDLARNEFEAAQIVLRRPDAYRITGVTFSALNGQAGSIAASNLAYNFVDYQRLNRNSNNVYPLIRTGAGDYPDRLTNETAKDVAPSTTQSIWIRAFAPKEAAAGVYNGTVTVDTNQGSFAVPLTVDLRNVTLPDSKDGTYTVALWQLFTGAISWDEGRGDTVDLYYGFSRYSPEWYELMDNVAKMMKQYRTNDFAIPIVRHLMDSGSKQNADGSFTFDWARFDEVVEFMISRGVVKRLEGFWMGGFNGGGIAGFNIETLDTAGKRKWVQWNSTAGLNWIDRFFPALRDHIRAKGWESIFWTHVSDEPQLDAVSNWRGLAGRIRQNWSNVKLGDAVFNLAAHKEIIDFTDLMIPQTDAYDADRAFFDQKRAEGKELWYYVCQIPRGNYLNRLIDQPQWNQRLMGWSAYSRGATGFLHWAMNNWQYETDAQDPKGDGHIVYPDRARKTVEVSPRYEALRDGAEDYEVLAKIADQGLARGLATSLMQRNDKYTPDTAYMQRIRALALDAAAGKPINPDLARNAATTASAGNGAAAVDGNDGTAWQPGTGTQWLRVDLGRQAQLDGVKLRWGSAGVGYKVQQSYDGARWTDAYVTGPTDGGTDFVGLNGKARYVRIETAAGTPSLTSLEVAGAALAKANAAGGKTYSLSSTPNNKPDSGIESTDGVLADAWDDGRTYGYQSPTGTVDVTIDLGSAQEVDSAAVHAYEEYVAYRPGNVRISTSTDGTTFSQRGQQFAPLGRSGIWYEFGFSPVQARYVRLTFAKTYGGDAGAMLLDEIEVYAAAGQNQAAGRPYAKAHPAPTDPAYPDTGGTESTDGVIAGGYVDGKGYGYHLAANGQTITLDLLVDLGAAKTLSQVKVAKYTDSAGHDYGPANVRVFAGDAPLALPLIRETTTANGTWFELATAVTARYVKVQLTKTRTGDFADYLFVDEVQVLDGSGANVALNRPYAKSLPASTDAAYPDTNGTESTNGVVAGGYGDGHGYAYRLATAGAGVTVDLLVDLGASRTVGTVRLQRFDDGGHDYGPNRVAVWTGDSPVTMTARGATWTPDRGWFDVSFAATSARYVRVQVTKTRTHDLADYLFLDEVTAG